MNQENGNNQEIIERENSDLIYTKIFAENLINLIKVLGHLDLICFILVISLMPYR